MPDINLKPAQALALRLLLSMRDEKNFSEGKDGQDDHHALRTILRNQNAIMTFLLAEGDAKFDAEHLEDKLYFDNVQNRWTIRQFDAVQKKWGDS